MGSRAGVMRSECGMKYKRIFNEFASEWPLVVKQNHELRNRMNFSDQYYAPEVAAKAVIELTKAMRGASDDAYARALLTDPRMVSNRGHLASCGVNMRKVKKAKLIVSLGMPTLEEQRRAIEFLNALDHEQGASHG